MPKIPTVDRQIRLATEASGVRVSAPQMANPMAEAIGEAGKAIFEVGEKIKKVREEEEIGRATIFATQKIGELENEALQDSDVIGYDEKYRKKLEDLKTGAISQIRNPEAKAKFTRQLDLDLINTNFKIKQYGYKKLIDQRKATIAEETTNLQNLYLSEVNPSIKQQYLDKIASNFNTAAKDGVISKEDAYTNFEKIKQNLPYQQARYDIYNDDSLQEKDSLILAELRKGNDGRYKDVNYENLLKLMEESQRRIFQNNQTFKKEMARQSEARHDTVIDKIASGTLTMDDLNNEMIIPEEEGGVKKSILLSYQKALQRDIVSDLKNIIEDDEKAANYLNLIDNFIDDSVDTWKAKEYLANAYADEILSPKEAKFLNGIKRTLKDIEWNRRTDFIKKSIDWFKSKNQNLTDRQLALKIKNMLDTLASGDEPEKVMKEFIKKDNLINRPEISTHDEKGQLMIDKDGNKAIVYPDGHTEEK